MENIFLNQALKYTELGWHVFPCNNQTKAPLTKRGFHDATTDRNVIRAWWGKRPEALIGVACGKSGIVVIDIDIKDNRDGMMTWESIKRDDILTCEQRTQSGGRQLVLKADEEHPLLQGSDVNGYHGIDIRNHGGYIIVAPSVMADGCAYEWLSDQSPFEIALSAIPDWVYDLFGTQNTRKKFEIPKKTVAGNRDTTIFKMACSLMSRNDMPFDQVLAACKTYNAEHCEPPLSFEDVHKKVESAFRYKGVPLTIVEGLEELRDNKEGLPAPVLYLGDKNIPLKDINDLKWDYIKGKEKVLAKTFNNIRNIIESSPEIYDVFRMNEFSGEIDIVKYSNWMKNIYPGKKLDDSDILMLKDHIRTKYRYDCPTNLLHEVVDIQAINNSYHPIKEYLGSLKWDGIERLGSWLSLYCGAEDSAYTRAVGELVLIAACARIERPGCKYDYMVILEGEQGIGKSQVVNILGGDWAGEVNLMARDKDTIDKMRGKWIIEVPEMVSFKKQEIESLKAFISFPVDRARLAYARKAQNFPRQCVFICTINPDNSGYLVDNTGNRRFLPVRLGNIDLNELRKDKDQLWAEAWLKSKKRPNLYISDKVVLQEVLEQQRGREQFDEMTNEVETWVNLSSTEYVTGKDIYLNVFQGAIDKFGIREQKRIGRIMRHLGWKRQAVRLGGFGNFIKAYVKDVSVT